MPQQRTMVNGVLQKLLRQCEHPLTTQFPMVLCEAGAMQGAAIFDSLIHVKTEAVTKKHNKLRQHFKTQNTRN